MGSKSRPRGKASPAAPSLTSPVRIGSFLLWSVRAEAARRRLTARELIEDFIRKGLGPKRQPKGGV